MCLIIVKPPNIKIPFEYLQKGWQKNKDGAGYAYTDNNQLIVKRGFMNFDDFINSYNTDIDSQLCVIHFRAANRGKVCPEFCHPFKISEDSCVFHNGTLWGFGDKEKNDTEEFTNIILKHVDLGKKYANWLITETIGTFNKLVILNSDNSYIIVNEKEGTWENGLWLSNVFFKNEVIKKNNTNPNLLALPAPHKKKDSEFGLRYYGLRRKLEKLYPANHPKFYRIIGTKEPMSQLEIAQFIRAKKKELGKRTKVKHLVGRFVEIITNKDEIEFYMEKEKQRKVKEKEMASLANNSQIPLDK